MDFSRMEEVRAGGSGDRKYHAWDNGGQEYFLRLSPPEKWEKAQRAFALQKKAFQLGLPVSEPLELTQEDGQVRFVERWLSGRMAEDALPALPQEEQYRLGREAGRVLRALHGCPARQKQRTGRAGSTRSWTERSNCIGNVLYSTKTERRSSSIWRKTGGSFGGGPSAPNTEITTQGI